MTKIYLIVGVPGSSKSWVCEQLKDKYEYIPHDDHFANYLDTILETKSNKEILIETPFSISILIEPLLEEGKDVETVFIIEEAGILHNRWAQRGMDKLSTIKGHLSRQNTYKERADKWGAFVGNSIQVLEYLKTKV